jgi:MFS family permease
LGLYFAFILALFSVTSVLAARVLLVLYALKFGAQPFVVGVLVATYSVFPMLLSWQVGRLSDRFGSRWLLMFGAAVAACGMMVPYFVLGMSAIYVAAVMSSLSSAFFGVSLQNLVGLLSEPNNRTLNFNNYSLVTSVCNFLSPLIAGFSIDISGHAIACLYLVVLSLVPILMLVIWGSSLPKGSGKTTSTVSVRDMLVAKGMWRVLATSSLVVTGTDLFQLYMPIHGHDSGLSASAIGIVLSMFAAAAFVLRLVLPRLMTWLSEEKLLAYSFFIGAASLMLMPFFKSAVLLSMVSFTFGLGMGCGKPITMTLTFSNSEEGHSGEALGLRTTVNQLTKVIVPVIFGSIGSAFGLFPAFWINALMLMSGGAITIAGTAISERT